MRFPVFLEGGSHLRGFHQAGSDPPFFILVCVQVSMQERGVGALEFDLQAVVSHQMWALGTELSSLRATRDLTTEPSLQTPCFGKQGLSLA